MTEQEFNQLEQKAGYKLPEFYRTTLLNYPFEPDSCAEDCMLPSRVEGIAGASHPAETSFGISKPFFIGDDGGEEAYFIDAGSSNSSVYVYEFETGKHRLLFAKWNEYLDHIRACDLEGAADEEYLKQLRENRKWWEFWKR